MIIEGTDKGEKLVGTSDRDFIYSRDGDDRIYSKSGNDLIGGGKGDDYLNTDGGNDRLSGGPGDDTYVGGGGRDQFVIYDDGDDLIRDFGNGHDRVQLYANTGGDPDPTFSFDQIDSNGDGIVNGRDEGIGTTYIDGDKSLHIDLGVGWEVTFQDVLSLREGDILF